MPPKDPDKLAEAVLKLYLDNSLRKTMGQNGRRYAEKNHLVAIMLDEELFKWEGGNSS